MANQFIEHIIEDIRSLKKIIVLTENPDAFLLRKDVVQVLSNNNIFVFESNKLEQRIAFELRGENDASKILLFLSDDNTNHLDDIVKGSAKFEFHISNYIKGYHTPSIFNCNFDVLNELYKKEQIVSLSKKETKHLIESIKPEIVKPEFDTVQFKSKCEELILAGDTDWFKIIDVFSDAIMQTIETYKFKEVIDYINVKNESFQEEIKEIYKSANSASPLKKPKIVSRILDNLSYNHKDEKVSLIVVDGMAFWQYLILKKHLNASLQITDNYTYSWIPSITQLSRQAIFKGAPPDKNYVQNPNNEGRLWKKYWLDKGLNEFEIRYNHEKVDLTGLDRITKFAIVFKDLDEKMHSSTDYVDLKDLTENWIGRDHIISVIDELVGKGFKIYLTTDHGNLLAKGWRSLKGREKLGTNKSGSRSTRHIEYSDKQLADYFIETNPDINDKLMRDNNAIYFINNLSFSKKDHLVTHGGSHILEVMIPFVKIEK